jgi:hypothetical protein
MNPAQRNRWERKRAAGKLAWIGKGVLLTVCVVALGGFLAVRLGGWDWDWKDVAYVLAASVVGGLLGSLRRWNARERAYRSDQALEALHHLS